MAGRSTALLALAVLLAACDSPFGNGRKAPAEMEPVGLATRSGQAGTPAADSLAVRVVDRRGGPVPGVTVAFATTGGGSLSPASAVTGRDGIARAQWALGTTAGEQSATATAPGLDAVVFTAAVGPAEAARVALTPESLRFTSLGQTVPIHAAVTDAFGNAIARQPVVVVAGNGAIVEVNGGETRSRQNGTTRLVATLPGTPWADSSEVVVRQVATEIAEMPRVTLVVGETARLRTEAYDAARQLVPDTLLRFAAAPNAFFSVTPTGRVTALSAGTDSVRVYTDAASRWVRVTVVQPNLPRVSQVSTGGFVACAVREDGKAFCWGFDHFGKLGHGPEYKGEDCSWGWSCVPTPVAVAGGLTFRQVAATGEYHVCGLTTGGAAYCWGLGRSGALGTGGTSDSPIPVAVSGGHTFVQIAVGGSVSCGRTAQGQAWCWGSGQLGNGGTAVALAPVQVSGGLSFTDIAVGASHACGIAGRRAYCWGYNAAYSLGTGDEDPYREPVPVAGNLLFKDIAAGGYTSCGVTEQGGAYCWGSNESGAVGVGPSPGHRPVPTRVMSDAGFDAIDTGGGRTCALTADGRAFCWGLYPDAARSMADRTNRFQIAPPAAVPGNALFSAVVSGQYSSCGIDTAGRLRCWHSNAAGLLGDGTKLDSDEPVYVRMPSH